MGEVKPGGPFEYPYQSSGSIVYFSTFFSKAMVPENSPISMLLLKKKSIKY
jgi:hypothetical protein